MMIDEEPHNGSCNGDDNEEVLDDGDTESPNHEGESADKRLKT